MKTQIRKNMMVAAAITAVGLVLTQLNAAQMPEAEENVSGSEAIATFAGGCFWCTESGF